RTLFYFFFSSRRRHTRSKRDWSSDVCSSDLRNSEKGVTMKYSPYIYVILIILLISTSMDKNPIQAEETNMYKERLSLYKKTEAISNVPWYYLAAMDQYERN